MGTQRVEAFSDGVFAIAITLLVLDINRPGATTPDLGRELLDLWPSYLAYVVSFATIGLFWVSHHFHFARVRDIDRRSLYMNLATLMLIAFIPFPTAVLADRLDSGIDESVAAAFYAGTMALLTALFTTMSAYEFRHGLVTKHVPAELSQALVRTGTMNAGLYVVASGIAFISPIATVVICFAMAFWNAFGGPKLRRLRAQLQKVDVAAKQQPD